MGALHRFEQRLEQMVTGAFARAFRSAVQPMEIAAALQREVDNSAQILSRDRRLAPNDFTIDLSPLGLRPAVRVRPDAVSRTGRHAPRARPRAALHVRRPGQAQLHPRRRPDHRPVPGPQRAPRPRCTPTRGANVTDTAIRRAADLPRDQRRAAPAGAAGSRRSDAAATPTCGSTTPASRDGTSSSASSRATDGVRVTVHGPRVDQRNPGQRPARPARRASTTAPSSIGGTRIVVRHRLRHRAGAVPTAGPQAEPAGRRPGGRPPPVRAPATPAVHRRTGRLRRAAAAAASRTAAGTRRQPWNG